MNREQFYITHYNRDMTCSEVAKALGITATRCKTAACDLRRKGYDVAKRAKPAGHVSEWQRKTGVAKRIKQPDGSWKYTPIGRADKTRYKIGDTVKRGKKQDTYVKTATGWEYVRKCPIKVIISADGRTPAKSEKWARNEKERAKRGISNDRNPDKVKVRREEGGIWVKIDSRTMVYRKQNAA